MTRNCRHCGKEFTPRKAHVDAGMGIYCSRRCCYDHRLSLPLKDYQKRFWAKVDYHGPIWNGTPCWVWTACKTKDGYSRFGLPRRGTVPAYWVSWSLLRGEIDKNLEFDHLCRNHSCVNPDHLEPVTARVNLLRGQGQTAMNAQKTHCIRGHEFTPENTYIQQGWRQCKLCRTIRQQQWNALHPGYQAEWKKRIRK